MADSLPSFLKLEQSRARNLLEEGTDDIDNTEDESSSQNEADFPNETVFPVFHELLPEQIAQAGVGAIVLPRKGVLRRTVVLLDFGDSLKRNDAFTPSKRVVVPNSLETFFREYFAQSPLSEAALVAMRDGKAYVESPLSPTLSSHVTALAKLAPPLGLTSLQNGLDVALSLLQPTPDFCRREVLILFGASATVDPGNVLRSIARLKEAHVTASVVCFGPELRILNATATALSGVFCAAQDPQQLDEVLASIARPTPMGMPGHGAAEATAPAMVCVGFATRNMSEEPTVCACHSRFVRSAFRCPRCHANLCQGNGACAMCGLPLMLYPYLLRCLPHLRPPWHPQHATPCGEVCGCCYCGEGVQECPSCKALMCDHCAVFCEKTLQCCPRCRG